MVSEISILIPVYNQNVLPLVEALHQEATALSVAFEIRVYDDGSNQPTRDQNRRLPNVSGVIYQEQPQNVGRSQIRYLLAQEAQYPTLLFLDNDVLPVHQDFLKRYLSVAGNGVAVGGVAYQDKAPAGLELRWKYGKAREEVSARVRQKAPYQRVFSSNLLVPKNLFLAYFPQKELTGYGHEDTLFAWRLKQDNLPVLHLENPVWHVGLEPADVFLLKTQQALHNLVLLHHWFHVGEDTKLFKTYRKLKKWRMGTLFQENSNWLFPLLKRNLTSRNPNLRLFDLYRLLLLDRYLRE
ncbi:glycosyltransferase family 2 protein [Rufibacter sp. XAAS-G3-1]|uniref:glycosyltransferase family 2 protein n=1 Tax=Rufibacter sp. XAAS-G3-1 TaxID=2729134 RepID=UPI0015E6472B|nr:glycosyltransferase [Rufibacter sp. XAAS-G3-1]